MNERKGVPLARSDAVRRSIAALPFVVYGYTLHKAWMSANPVISSSIEPVLLGPIDPIGFASSFLAIVLAVLFHTFKKERLILPVLICGITFSLVATVLFSLSFLLPASDFGIVGSFSFILQSIGSVLLSVLWIDLYASLNPIRAAFAYAASSLASIALVFVIEGCSPDRAVAILAALPILTGICLILALRKNGKFSEEGGETQLILPYKAIAFIAAYSFSYGIVFALGYAEDSPYAAVVPAAIVVGLVFVDARKFTISLLFRISFPIMISGFLFISVIPGMPHASSSFMLDIGFAAMRMLLFLMVCTISYSTGASPIWLFGILGASQFLARSIGVSFGSMLDAAPGSFEYGIVEAGAIVLVIVASFMLATEKGLFSFWKPGAESDIDENRNEASDLARSRIDFLAITYQLTDREVEIVALLARGKTNAEIAQEAFISEGTVKVHLHHIYRKLGIHTRKELRALVEEKPTDRIN